MQSLITSFSTGMEAVFGDMLAKKEMESLKKSFNYYGMLLSVVSMILLSTTAVMIIPFVKLYTSGITDADYIIPFFAFLMIVTTIVFCVRMPYNAMVVAAGLFKETKVAAYGEVLINVFLSIVLVKTIGLAGVAIGTLAGTLFRFLYYVGYFSENIIKISPWLFVKRVLNNALIFAVAFFAGNRVLDYVNITNYFNWAMVAAVVAVISVVVTLAINFMFYKNDLSEVISRYIKIVKK